MREQLEESLTRSSMRFIRYAAGKPRPVVMASGAMSLEKFCKTLLDKLGAWGVEHAPDLFKALYDTEAIGQLLQKIHNESSQGTSPAVGVDLPPEMKGLVLNCDMTAKSRDERFFLTTKDERISNINGDLYVRVSGMKDHEAFASARMVVPEYLPRRPKGIFQRETKEGPVQVFNTYMPPDWMFYEGDTPKTLPLLFQKLVRHLIPIDTERTYFFHWLHASLFSRAYTYLILCGPPGTGKNRLKLVMRALHGFSNTVDGKKSTISERFNGQLADATLTWFDELRYDEDNENVMKELQNDTISIERKGIDATTATRIYSSFVISNNKPRDNYIAFDARKFVPLYITSKRLERSMTSDEISLLTRKVENPDHKDFDIAFIAQIGRWLQSYARDGEKWPNLEYRGSMFWKLCHTTMTKWQKKSVDMLIELENGNRDRATYDESKGYLWSSVEKLITRKAGERHMPDYTTVQHFFRIFRDGRGKPSYDVQKVTGPNIMSDFWVKPKTKNIELLSLDTFVEDDKPVESTYGKKKTKRPEIYDL